MQFVPVPRVGCESYHHCSWPQKEWMFTAAGRLVLVPGDGEDRGRTSGLMEGLGCQHSIAPGNRYHITNTNQYHADM